jgi:outer membrane biosynthesis protein TonB
VLRHPLVARLGYQLVPAALVTVVGVMTLSNLAKTPDPASVAPVQTAITTEAVFTATPHEAETPTVKSIARPAAVQKPVVAASAPQPPRKPEPAPRQVASAPAPLPTVQIPEQPQAAAAESDTSVLGRLRSATTSVTQMPRWAAQSVSGWFQVAPPPRPPAAVPQNFQAAM